MFVLHKGSVMTAITLTTAAAATAMGVSSITAGTVIWDSVRGHQPGYDYFLTSATFTTMPATATTLLAANGFMQTYVQSLTTSDSGTYYCSFADGNAASANIGSSGSLTITMTTKSSSRAPTFKNSKVLEYTIALLGASRIIL